MAIISTETKASAAPPGNHTGLSFNSSHQQEAYQGLAEEGVASLITAEQFAAWHKTSLCTDLLVVAVVTTHDAFIPLTFRRCFSYIRSVFDFLFLHFKVEIS